VAEPIVEDLACGDLQQQVGRYGQPVSGAHSVAQVDAEAGDEPGGQVEHLDAVVDRPVAGGLQPSGLAGSGWAEVGAPAAHRGGHPLGERLGDLVAVPVGVGRAQEQQHAWSPVVVGRPGGVVADDSEPGPSSAASRK
jgi:hypothetical protein